MPKLVVLSEGLTGRSHDIKMERTTIGRVEDNTFQIPEQSVSSHHCEIIQRGPDIFIRDLNSTNGTFVGGQQISTETLVKPGSTFRLGKVDVRLEVEGQPAPAKKLPAQTTALPTGGIKLNELDQIGKTVTFDKTSPFSKKSDSGAKMFMIGAIIAGVIILGVIVWLIFSFGNK
jgi:pSer/pThr/pTyr-binding forkhead associated (FHA) protein